MPVRTFNYTGSIQNFVVPPGVSSLIIRAIGAPGGGWRTAAPASGGWERPSRGPSVSRRETY